jgi:ABC-type multidrug transport system fused ATPase/permease subunit
MAIVFGFLAIVIVGGLMAIDGALNVGVYRENIAYGAFDATDEASVDAAKLGEAHDFIMQLADGYDTIAIAHRLSTVRNADHIFVLERGELIEQGRHDDLIAAAGLYGSLWRVQTGRAVEHA